MDRRVHETILSSIGAGISTHICRLVNLSSTIHLIHQPQIPTHLRLINRDLAHIADQDLLIRVGEVTMG